MKACQSLKSNGRNSGWFNHIACQAQAVLENESGYIKSYTCYDDARLDHWSCSFPEKYEVYKVQPKQCVCADLHQ